MEIGGQLHTTAIYPWETILLPLYRRLGVLWRVCRR